MNATTATIKNRKFTTSEGTVAVVYNEKEISERNGFTGYGRTVRTYAVVEGVEIDMDPGCSYQAERVVQAHIAETNEAAEIADADRRF